MVAMIQLPLMDLLILNQAERTLEQPRLDLRMQDPIQVTSPTS